MDRLTRTANVIKAYYSYKNTLDSAPFVKSVCDFFDFIKNEPLNEADMNFLIFLANEAGVPQYFDLLEEKYTDCRISNENINALTLSALFHEASLIRGDNKLHRYQKNVIDNFGTNEKNRYVLSAPTSFGKTFLVYEIIQKMQYQNILLIFPAISLLSENYARLCKSEDFQAYKVHSLSEEEFDLEEKNIFIFTPERFLSFLDVYPNMQFDFAFIDEIYKIDNSFIIDQETSAENERDTAYRLALEFVCDLTEDMLLAGPYMELPLENTIKQNSFVNFAIENEFELLRYNQIEIVSKEYATIKSKKQYKIDETIVEVGNNSKSKKIANLVEALSTPRENTIIYCGKKSDTEKYAKNLIQDQDLIASFHEKCKGIESTTYEMFLNHLESTFGDDWIVLKALKCRIGIHHGLIPKYIQKEIINLFNEGTLLCLFSTTTITEGVNTSAKNIIITSNKKGLKPLKQFDAKNIAGRAGRFYQHYSGRVIDLNNKFEEIVNGDSRVLEHKNYDINSKKTDIDYQITKDKYLSERERKDKHDINAQIIASEIPVEVFDCFKVVGPKDKLKLYNGISTLSTNAIEEIKQFSKALIASNARSLNWDGFQTIMDTVLPVIQEEKLKTLITIRVGAKQYSLITVLLNSYLRGGFVSMVKYYVGRKDTTFTKDQAMRKVADIVYNVFKYHLVKYLGIFDVFFRYIVSKHEKVDMDKVMGLGLLLQKLEYNALSPEARKISDYGVPFKLIDCYDGNKYDKEQFDPYEQYIDKEINRIFYS